MGERGLTVSDTLRRTVHNIVRNITTALIRHSLAQSDRKLRGGLNERSNDS